MSQWFNFRTGKVIPPREMFERLNASQLQGAEYALRVVYGALYQGKSTVREYHGACVEVMESRATPKRKKKGRAA